MSSHNENDEVPTRPSPDLPYEILSKISENLGVIELLSFRSSCKTLLSASSTASALIQSSLFPWFLFIRKGNQECRLYNPQDQKGYALNLPELKGTRCLCSKDGWLLMMKGPSVFFYCPISRAKISLPGDRRLFFHTRKEIVGSFSSYPTEPDCVVTVLIRLSQSLTSIGSIRQGEPDWSAFSFHDILDDVGAIKWNLQLPESLSFCYFDGLGSGICYHMEGDDDYELPVSPINIQAVGKEVNGGGGDPPQHGQDGLHYVPNAVGDDEVLRAWLNLQENESLTTRGTLMTRDGIILPIYNESIVARSGKRKGPRSIGIWFHPRYYQLPADYSW